MSALIDLKKTLLKKYDKDMLAQVYLARYGQSTDPKIWFKEFLSGITKLSDHPDVLWVSRDLKKDKEQENEYKVDSASIKSLLNFLNFKAYELKKKFIFIEDAHLLSVIVSNKLLKVLEEMPVAFCLFLLAPKQESLLPTVESRAIKILLPENLEALPTTVAHFSGAQEAVLELKKAEDSLSMEKSFIENSLQRVIESGDFLALEAALDNLKMHSVSESFNNSKAARLSPFFF
jgi:DNA polymerase-3 subunit delta'